MHVAVLKREIEILKELIRQGMPTAIDDSDIKNDVMKELIIQGMAINDRDCDIKYNTSHYYFGKIRVRLP